MGKLLLDFLLIIVGVIVIIAYAHHNEATTFAEINAAIESDFRSIATKINWFIALLLIQPFIFLFVKFVTSFLEKKEEEKRINNL